MKNIILSAIVAGTSLFVATPKAEAGSCKPRVTYSCMTPVYKVKTVVVNRCRYKKAAYDNCGRKYFYWVTVITYRDIWIWWDSNLDPDSLNFVTDIRCFQAETIGGPYNTVLQSAVRSPSFGLRLKYRYFHATNENLRHSLLAKSQWCKQTYSCAMSESEPPKPVSLEALRADDHVAWEQASLELWRVVRSKARSVIPHATESELEDLASPLVTTIASQIIDPTQEAFVKAMSFADYLNLTARIAHRRAVDYVRKSEVRSREENVEHIKDLYSQPETPTDSAMVNERKIRIHAAICELPEKDRIIIEDFYFSKLGTREIAKKLELSNGAVCARLSAARNKLGDLIQIHGLGKEDLQ